MPTRWPATTATILIVLRAGDVPAGEVETINGGGGTDVLILNGFSKDPDLLFPGTAPGSMQSAAERQLVNPVTGGIYRLINVERVEYTQVVAELGNPAERTVSVLLVNPAATASKGRLLFFGQDGAIVPATTKGNQPANDDLTFTVPALGSLRVDAIVRGSVTAQVFASTPLGAIVRGAAAPATLGPAHTPLIDSAFVPVVEHRASGVSTGVLIANSVTQSTIKLTLYALDGEEMDGETFFGMKEIEMPAYGHRVVFIRDLFPNLNDFQGGLTVDGGDGDRPQEGGPISVVVLERGAAGRVTASPALAMFPALQRQPVHVAGLTSSGDSLLLVNPAPNGGTRGTLRFFDEAGQPWALSVNRRPPATSVDYDLGTLGSEVFTTSGTGPIQRGTARAESSEGILGAVLRVTSADRSVVRIPASETYNNFMTAVRRETASGVTTRLSLSSTGSPLVLRSDAPHRGWCGGHR